ncbi:MAG: hypothetical protein J5985_08450 [Kiritimatiellae bacterium]|nr:hypothetical protein [Kiritimatiellia bacterium]
MVTVLSFSFRNPPSVPLDGFVFDCRMLPNPARVERLRDKTGLDADVRAFFAQHADEIEAFLRPVKALATFAVKAYAVKGNPDVRFFFGCMGGRHRSVYCAECLAEWLRKSMHTHVTVRHFVVAGGTHPVASR